MNHKPQTLTLAALQTSPEYLACKPQGQVWLTAFVTNGHNYVDATAVAYPTCKTREKARVVSYTVRHWPRIAAALDLYFGRPPADVFQLKRTRTVKQLVKMVRFQLRHAEPGSIAGQRLTSQLTSLLLGTKSEAEDDDPEVSKPPTPKPAPDATPTAKVFYVGQRVTQRRKDGTLKVGTVTEVDANGRATKIEDAPQ